MNKTTDFFKECKDLKRWHTGMGIMASQCEACSNGHSGSLGEGGGRNPAQPGQFLVAKKPSRLNFPRRKRLHWKYKHALNRLQKLRPSAGHRPFHLPFRLSDSVPSPLRLPFPSHCSDLKPHLLLPHNFRAYRSHCKRAPQGEPGW